MFNISFSIMLSNFHRAQSFEGKAWAFRTEAFFNQGQGEKKLFTFHHYFSVLFYYFKVFDNSIWSQFTSYSSYNKSWLSKENLTKKLCLIVFHSCHFITKYLLFCKSLAFIFQTFMCLEKRKYNIFILMWNKSFLSWTYKLFFELFKTP